MRKGIGIDFGTTNSSVALARDDDSPIEPVRFRTSSGTTETYRSVLYFEPRAPGIGGPIAIEEQLRGPALQRAMAFQEAGTQSV